ncbi:hypothetical protein C9J60_01255 [Streptomyces sp. A244]|nr:hypothetical protein [Streptomyces sp. A244]PTH89663.1 hypothetical protein C9J60_01255 [Streptomyces sp. A244]
MINTPLVLRACSLLLRAAGLSAEPETIAPSVPDAAVAWQTAVAALYLTDALVDLSDDLGSAAWRCRGKPWTRPGCAGRTYWPGAPPPNSRT